MCIPLERVSGIIYHLAVSIHKTSANVNRDIFPVKSDVFHKQIISVFKALVSLKVKICRLSCGVCGGSACYRPEGALRPAPFALYGQQPVKVVVDDAGYAVDQPIVDHAHFAVHGVLWLPVIQEEGTDILLRDQSGQACE